MSPARAIPCVFARAGTSRGAFLLRSDLPADQATLDRVILAVYGSPDPRQIDGLGGGDPLTSKVAIVAPSARKDADVDYTFGQVGIDTATIYWVGNCGNMSSGVGPFAIKRGLVKPTEPETVIRIYNTNTDKVLIARVAVRDGEVVEEGEISLAGVPGTGSPIFLDFGDCGGAVTGLLLPTGSPRDEFTLANGKVVTVSIVDAATPFVFVAAKDLDKSGIESAAEINADATLLAELEEIRAMSARRLGLVGEREVASVVSPSIPRVTMVAPPCDYKTPAGKTVNAADIDIVGRQLSMQQAHKTYAVTGSLCTAVAAMIPGTVVHEVSVHDHDALRIGHPDGVIVAKSAVTQNDLGWHVNEASTVRTARTIMDGTVRVPSSTWPLSINDKRELTHG